MPGWNVALPSESVAFSGSFVPSAKSKLEKLLLVVAVAVDVDVDVLPVLVIVVLDDVDVELEDVVVEVVSPDKMVAAPAATTHRTDIPAPTMEPVSLIFILRTPAIKPVQGLTGRLTNTSGQ